MLKHHIMRISPVLLVIIVMALSGCKGRQDNTGDTEVTGFEKSMTAEDTATVIKLVNTFFEYAESGKYADAAGMLYAANDSDNYAEPELLDNEQMEVVRRTLRSLPIKSHKIDYIKFNRTFSNEVKVTAIIEEAHDGMPEIKTVYYFKPFDYLGGWRLCYVDTNNGDTGLVDESQKEALTKEFNADQEKASAQQ